MRHSFVFSTLAITFFAACIFCLKSFSNSREVPQTSEAKSSAHVPEPTNPQIDYQGFQDLVGDVRKLRMQRLVPVDRFLEMANQPGTIILDTRSKQAFDEVHWKNAIHLNFSDFTKAKLASVIPDKQTRILIYCNNNFKEQQAKSLTLKEPPLALNVPTFVNLHGYGYSNIYELGETVSVEDARIELIRAPKPSRQSEGSRIALAP